MNVYAILKILILNRRYTLTEVQEKLNAFLAMDEITTDQYVELTELATKNETDMMNDVTKSIDELKAQNEMLTECILELASIIYA